MSLNESRDSRKRLAIIGAGSSGLIMLFHAKLQLADWDITVLEQSNSVIGCWGRPYPGFVSTSTKFTTQFSCFPKFDASILSDHGASRSEFFREGEYGEYLESFAETFGLRQHIRFQTCVQRVEWDDVSQTWKLHIISKERTDQDGCVESFDAVIICTGLAAKAKMVDLQVPCLTVAQLNQDGPHRNIQNCRIVVMGGGESAVDHACRLAHRDRNNEVFLSLQSGIRVSPRYHPIRGVPSDFLRNRLMLSINEQMRNWIGQKFVECRILYEERFRKWFPAATLAQSQLDAVIANSDSTNGNQSQLRKQWAYRLTKSAKDNLFNMFHNKSDDFLELVSEGRIRIVGQPVDSSACEFYEFQSNERLRISPDWIVPSIGYQSTLASISDGQIRLADCYLGCVSLRFPRLYLIGFARPIIGNIPTISEMQATFVSNLLSNKSRLPVDALREHEENRLVLKSRFATLNLDAIYPVEMFPYCDELAKRMGRYPSLLRMGSFVDWVRLQCSPATTLHYYWENPESRTIGKGLPIYMPRLLILLLLLLKPIDWALRAWFQFRSRMVRATTIHVHSRENEQ